MKSKDYTLSRIAAFLGILVSPTGTPITLFRSYAVPPYAVGFLLLFLVTALAAPGWFVITSENPAAHQAALAALVSFLAVTLVSFLVLEAALLLILAVPFRLIDLLSTVCYLLVPISVAIGVLYFSDYSMHGAITIPRAILGSSLIDSTLYQVIGVTMLVTQLHLILTLAGCIYSFGRTHSITAFILALISTGCLLLALGAGTLVAEAVNPGSARSISAIGNNILGFSALSL